MEPAASVLARFGPHLVDSRWQAIAGGFSGAIVWRGEDARGGSFALKLWPPEFDASRLVRIQGWMSEAKSLSFVPTVYRTLDDCTFITHGGRLWELTRWMPGEPLRSPAIAEIEAACDAVARLHHVWRTRSRLPSPGIHRRLELLRGFQNAPIDLGLGIGQSPAVGDLLRRLREQIAGAASRLIGRLQGWEPISLPVQPCLRDLRSDHVLFLGSSVTGIVDYGAMALDTPAVDLARLLGDLAGDNESGFRAGLIAYRKQGGELGASDDLVRLLDESGVYCSAINWFIRLSGQRGAGWRAELVSSRLAYLSGRIEKFAPA